MPNIPTYTDLLRQQRNAARNRTSLQSVLNNSSPVSQSIPAPTPPPPPTSPLNTGMIMAFNFNEQTNSNLRLDSVNALSALGMDFYASYVPRLMNYKIRSVPGYGDVSYCVAVTGSTNPINGHNMAFLVPLNDVPGSVTQSVLRSLSSSSSFTQSVWIRRDSTVYSQLTSNGDIVPTNDVSYFMGSPGFNFGYGRTPALTAFFVDAYWKNPDTWNSFIYTYPPAASLSANVPFLFDTWYHVAVVNDDHAKTLKMYINGNLQAQTTYFSGSALPCFAYALDALNVPDEFEPAYLIGCNILEQSRSCKYHDLDCAYVWGRALSASEIQQLYNEGVGMEYPFPYPVP